jgi:hypothetical protein
MNREDYEDQMYAYDSYGDYTEESVAWWERDDAHLSHADSSNDQEFDWEFTDDDHSRDRQEDY